MADHRAETQQTRNDQVVFIDFPANLFAELLIFAVKD
jgi:hypothetical protein